MSEIIISKSTIKLAVAGIVGLVLLLTFKPFTIISAGHVGVITLFGEVNMDALPEGMHFVNPLSNVRTLDVRVVKADLKGASASTKDLQQVHTDLVVNYRIDGAKAPHIYKEFGFNLEDNVLDPSTSEALKAVTAKYDSEELITKRDMVSKEIKQELQSKVLPYGLTIQSISVVNFKFSDDYQRAIESKVIATQSKLKAEQDLQRIEVEAKQAIAKAEGEARAIAIQSQAINAGGGKDYVNLKAIEKWDGKLSQVSGGNTPFINISK